MHWREDDLFARTEGARERAAGTTNFNLPAIRDRVSRRDANIDAVKLRPVVCRQRQAILHSSGSHINTNAVLVDAKAASDGCYQRIGGIEGGERE